MQKRCQCGQTMDLTLRTVIFAGKAKIYNVPIYSCIICSRSEVMSHFKSALTEVIHQYERKPEPLTIEFQDANEFAYVIYELFNQHRSSDNPRGEFTEKDLENQIEERTNLLLDLFLHAKELKDEEWMKNIQTRLSQIAGISITSPRVFP